MYLPLPTVSPGLLMQDEMNEQDPVARITNRNTSLKFDIPDGNG